MHTARFTVITPECIRIESSATGRFVDAPSLFALGPRARGPFVVAGAGDPECVIDTGRITLRYLPDGRPPGAENLRAEIKLGEHDRAEWRPGMAQTGNLGGTLGTLDGVRGPVDLGEGLLSRDGWYLLDDSRRHLLIDGWARERPHEEPGEQPSIDWYLFGYGRDYRAALRALTAVAGAVPLPRRYAMGSWYSRYWPYTSAEFRHIVDEYDRRGFPLDVMVMDMDWHREGWTGWSWNKDLVPDAHDLLARFHERGLAVTLNVHPSEGVGPHEDAYPEFMRALGLDPASRETVPFDAGNPVYMRALFERVHAPLERDGGACGVDFWWLDWQQERFTRSIADLENLRWLNELYFAHTGGGALERGVDVPVDRRVDPAPKVGAPPAARRGLSFSRWAGWGDHRHPIHFSGDSHTGWESLAFQVPFTSTAGNVGCFFWSHDIGGHFGARNEEATARWVQFGALSGAMRMHSARSGALDRRPWTYGPMYEQCMRAALSLRSELFPYVYSAAAACHEESVPLLRPVYLDNPGEARAYESAQEYLLGDDLLVAPIVSPGIGGRRAGVQAVWFPARSGSEGSTEPEEWCDWFTHERHAGGTDTLAACGIDTLPLYARAGVLIPMRPPTLRMGTAPLDHLILHCFPGRPGSVRSSTLYEDDGVSRAYEQGEGARTPLIARWGEGSVVIQIGPTIGRYEGRPAQREYSVEVMAVRAVGARVDGAGTMTEQDSEHSLLRIRIPARPIEQPVCVEVEFAAPENNTLRERAWRRRSALVHGVGPGGEVLPRDGMAAALESGVSAGADGAAVAGVIAGIGLRREGDRLRVYNAADAADDRRFTVSMIDRRGREVSEIGRSEVIVPPDGGVAVPVPAVGAPEPALGLFSRRIACLEFTIRGRAYRIETPIKMRSIPLSAWQVVGPFGFDPLHPLGERGYGPEEEVKAGALSRSYGDEVAGRVHWRAADRPADGHWPADLRHVFGSRNGAALGYAALRIRSPEDQDVALHIESGDRLALWVNGDLVFSSDTAPTDNGASQQAPAALKKGVNRLLVKTTEGGGGWGFRIAVDGRVPVEEDEMIFT